MSFPTSKNSDDVEAPPTITNDVADNITELLSSLPKEERWIPMADLYQYQGFWYPSVMFQGILSLQRHFQPLPTDILICGSPKTGNTWLKALCFAIATRTHKNTDTTRSLSTNLPHALIPILEFVDPQNPVPESCATTPRLLSTHLPLASLPDSVMSSGCKIIYVCREPKDTFVSLWHYQRKIENLSPSEESMNLAREFDRFCQGKIALGPYLDHVLGYYQAGVENPDKVLFLKYKEMKRDAAFYVKKVAAFIGKPFSAKEEEMELAEEIAKQCSFEKLSELEVNKSGKTNLIGPFDVDNKAYFRKGEVGDWRNCLSDEMVETIDGIVEEKLKGSSFRFGTK